MNVAGVVWQVKLEADAEVKRGWDLHFDDGLILNVVAVLDKRTDQLFTVAVCTERQ